MLPDNPYYQANAIRAILGKLRNLRASMPQNDLIEFPAIRYTRADFTAVVRNADVFPTFGTGSTLGWVQRCTQCDLLG